MLKKLTSLSLSVLICLALLPSQANAMGTPRNEQPVQVEDMENLGSFNNADAGIAPCRYTIYDDSNGGGVGGGIGAEDNHGNGKPFEPHIP